jgi:hypothetical protein
MESPLSLFESIDSSDSDCDGFKISCEPWVEQVDFRLPEDQWNSKKKSSKSNRGNPIPSLDEITARLHLSRSVSPPPLVVGEKRRPSTRLPAFLRAPVQPPAEPVAALAAKPRPTLSISVGGLQIPVRDTPASASQTVASPSPVYPPPKSPTSPRAPNLQITTLLVPRTATMSPTYLSKSNLDVLNTAHERTSKGMMSALKRRTIPSESPVCSSFSGHDDADDRKPRRNSSPADLPLLRRAGFEHPVLALPGGF